MTSHKRLFDTLDILVKQIAKISVLNSQAGLMNGKIGIAILLYQYGRYRNNSEMTEYADNLMEFYSQEIESGIKFGFDNGLYGIVWSIHYLIKQRFIQADEDIFDEIDAVIFRESHNASSLFNLGIEAEKGLYVWSRYISNTSTTENKWRQHIENCIKRFHKIVISKYTNYTLPVLPCRTLIRFFHVCQTLWINDLFRHEIFMLYEELLEIVKISYKEEKSISEKYILATLLREIPMFDRYIFIGDIPQMLTLTDVNNFYLTQWILGRKISIPKVVNKTILSITKNHQQINGLLDLLDSDNVGLGNDVGGLAWAIKKL